MAEPEHRLYFFRGTENVYALIAGPEMKRTVFKMTLPLAGRGRAAVETTVAECPEAAEFFAAVLDGEKLRDEFEKRGAY